MQTLQSELDEDVHSDVCYVYLATWLQHHMEKEWVEDTVQYWLDVTAQKGGDAIRSLAWPRCKRNKSSDSTLKHLESNEESSPRYVFVLRIGHGCYKRPSVDSWHYFVDTIRSGIDECANEVSNDMQYAWEVLVSEEDDLVVSESNIELMVKTYTEHRIENPEYYVDPPFECYFYDLHQSEPEEINIEDLVLYEGAKSHLEHR
eukprot:gb/GECG01005609.1/.p1 GENE.gb/GECG01005609.1/~~gb/GECG01005609.1/.p1  ORF type:complete len:203 (+),score=26.78 gb/GECG01005609.1/:1-609(+)